MKINISYNEKTEYYNLERETKLLGFISWSETVLELESGFAFDRFVPGRGTGNGYYEKTNYSTLTDAKEAKTKVLKWLEDYRNA